MLMASMGAWAQAQSNTPKVSGEPVDGNWAENTTWYTIHINDNNNAPYKLFADDTDLVKNDKNPTQKKYDDFLWCMTGNDTDGYKFYNKAKGTDKWLVMNTDNKVAFGTTDQKFHFTAPSNDARNGYWCIKVSENTYWNRNSAQIGTWDAHSLNDNGSSFLFIEDVVKTSPEPKDGKWSGLTTWFTIKTGNGYYLRQDVKDENGVLKLTDADSKTASTDDVALWCVTGDATNGYKFYNKAAGPDNCLAMTTQDESARAKLGSVDSENSTFEFVRSVIGGHWCVKYKGTEKLYLNRKTADSGVLSAWNSTDAVNGWANSGNGDQGSALLIEEVDYTLTLGEDGYSTLYLPKNVTLPEGLTAHCITEATSGVATLSDAKTSVPAYNGVILKGTASESYELTVGNATALGETNLLRGTVNETEINGDGYILAKKDGVIGLYKALLSENKFLNNANKAYLPASAVGAGAGARLLFDFGTETAIENIQGAENADAVVYDLAGRRVQGAQKGLYIVNGKKVIK